MSYLKAYLKWFLEFILSQMYIVPESMSGEGSNYSFQFYRIVGYSITTLLKSTAAY